MEVTCRHHLSFDSIPNFCFVEADNVNKNLNTFLRFVDEKLSPATELKVHMKD